MIFLYFKLGCFAFNNFRLKSSMCLIIKVLFVFVFFKKVILLKSKFMKSELFFDI
jgi:hypothetical protein